MAREGVEAYPGSVRAVDFLRSTDTRRRWFLRARTARQFSRRQGSSRSSMFVSTVRPLRIWACSGSRSRTCSWRRPDNSRVEPRRAIVVEDAIAGVQAGKKGGFGLVIGIARAGKHRRVEKARSRPRGRRPRGIAAATRPEGLTVMLRREIQTFPTFIYPHDPWRLVEKQIQSSRMPQMETLFALANGYLGIRGTFDEGHTRLSERHADQRRSMRPGRSSIRSPPTGTRAPDRPSSTLRTAH